MDIERLLTNAVKACFAIADAVTDDVKDAHPHVRAAWVRDTLHSYGIEVSPADGSSPKSITAATRQCSEPGYLFWDTVTSQSFVLVDKTLPHHYCIEEFNLVAGFARVLQENGQDLTFPDRYSAHQALFGRPKTPASSYNLQIRPGPEPAKPKVAEEASFSVGDRVVTVRVLNPSSDWDSDAEEIRMFGMKGVVSRRKGGHGVVYLVLYDQGGFGWFEPRELEKLA